MVADWAAADRLVAFAEAHGLNPINSVLVFLGALEQCLAAHQGKCQHGISQSGAPAREDEDAGAPAGG